MMGAAGVGSVATAQPVSPYRAIHHLRRGGLHQAFGLGADKDLTNDHLDRADKSTNAHVREMAKYARLHKNGK
jgi:hypothetical protein